jgi:sialate O-acetylesterase
MKLKTHDTNITFILNAAVILLLFVISLTIITSAQEVKQENKMWNKKKCAVCLTYDDALNVHLDNVVPLLDSLGLKATFYIPISFPGFKPRIKDWKLAARKGNELGNHSMFHPCEGNKPGREWVNPSYDLSKYTMTRLIDEIKLNSTVLNMLDNKTTRTYAYPCGDTMIGDSSYVPKIKSDFIGARSVTGRFEKPGEINLFDIGCFMMNGDSAGHMIELVKQAMDSGSLIVFLFHGVGGEHNINVSLAEHSKLLHFIKKNSRDIWVAPLVEICKYIKDHDMEKK